MKNRYIIKVITGANHRVYRFTGPIDIVNADWIKEMISNVVQDAGFFLDNSGTENEVLEVMESNRFKKIDLLFLSAQNIDYIEFQQEEVKDV